MTTSPAHQRRGLAPRTLVIIGFIGVIIFVLLLSLLSQPRQVATADPADTRLVAQGQIIYAARCASCHGANLEGASDWQTPLLDGSMPAPPHDQTGHTWHHNDESLFATVKYGGQVNTTDRKNTMPGFSGTLSDAEIWAALAYIKSTWPQEIQDLQKQGHE
jgi:S-disulfanyl-L-cysteine oxidoreductase SoxD